MNSTNWQLLLNKNGAIAEDSEDIEQCIKIIVTTKKGSLPHCPDFGCSLHQYFDAPITKSRPFIVRDVLDALADYEPRAIVKSVGILEGDHPGHWRLQIVWAIKDTAENQSTTITLKRGK